MADEEKLSRREQKKKDKEAKKANKDKKGKNGEDGDEEEGGGGIVVAIVAILIILVWLAIIALLIHMDVGGFGSTVAYPILKDVPYLNKILPESTDYSTASGDAQDDPYAFSSMSDAVDRVKELEQELASTKKKLKKAQKAADSASDAEKELQKYKDNEAQFEQEKKDFYNEVVYNDNAPDIEQYREYYEEIEPQTAEELYKQVVQDLQTDEALSNYVSAYSSMDPGAAAQIFDTMTDDLDLVGKILWNMNAEQRGDIMAEMNADTAAAVTKLMEPDNK